MRGRVKGALLLAGVFVVAMHGVAAAQNLLEKLVIPGPVIQGHAKVEQECGKCHEPFSRQSQTRLCLDCHKETAADRKARKGFHGFAAQCGETGVQALSH